MPRYSSVLPMTGEDRLIIEKVQTIHVHYTKGRKIGYAYLIEAHEPGRPELHWQLETLSPLRASLCERHIQDGRPLNIQWRRTAYGRDLEQVWEVAE